MSKIDKIFEDIKKERQYQIEKWGNDLDDKNTINDWVTYISSHVTQAAMGHRPPEQELMKAATLCVAALEALDRNSSFKKGHYDSCKTYKDLNLKKGDVVYHIQCDVESILAQDVHYDHDGPIKILIEPYDPMQKMIEAHYITVDSVEDFEKSFMV